MDQHSTPPPALAARFCGSCERHLVQRESRGAASWWHCPHCDRSTEFRPALHLAPEDGLPMCGEVRVAWDRYERLSFEPAVLSAQLVDRDICPRCRRAWLNAESEAEEALATYHGEDD